MKRESLPEYRDFWAAFGAVLKEGLLAPEEDRDRLMELVLAPSTVSTTEVASLADYAGRMKEGQGEIYFLAGPTADAVRRSPLLEAFTQKGYEVLLFSDPVDELWLERAPTYQGKALVSVSRGEVQLGSEEERKQETEAIAEKQKELGDLLACLRVHLQEEIKEVRLSGRLTSSPVCLVADEHDLSPRMQRMLEQLGQKTPKVKRILELNPRHELIERLQAVFKESATDPRLKLYADLLLGQAHLAESGQLPDPAAFARVLSEVMLRAV
jgi:molecular chaperone HtpG